MASMSQPALLPAFDPLPPVSFSDSPPSRSPVVSTFAEAPLASKPAAASKHSSGSSSNSGSTGNFFTRARSSSLHTSSSPVSAFFRRDEEAPPVPALPMTPGRDYSPRLPASSAQSTNDVLYPPIKSVTVPHLSKSGKSWVFACRVVPEVAPRPPVSREESSSSAEMVMRESLGKMELAGKGIEGAREPHTVWRTWAEFVEFSSRLSAVFPSISPSSPAENAPESGVPRLSKNRTFLGVMTSKTLSQRQADLDTFVRCLFEMPEEVRCSAIVRDFFRMRDEDLSSTSVSSASMAMPLPPSSAWGEIEQDGPDSFSSFLAQANSPNATVRPLPTKRRPALAVKVSMPNMRGTAMANDFEQSRRANTEDFVSHLRTSNYSVSTNSSASSSVTVTPQSMSTSASTSSLKKPSPLGAAFRFGGAPLEEEPVKVVKKRPSLGRLRHFRSLQDLRQQPSTPSVPTEPMPKLSSMGMLRAVTQPHPLPFHSPASSPTVTANPFTFASHAPGTGAISPAMSRNRSGSRSSSTSSFEDLWGGPGSAHMSPNPSSQSSIFRHGPSGRLDRVPETTTRPRRPSMPSSRHTAGSIGTKASCGHSSTPSTSSVGSTRSSNGGSSLDLSRSPSDFRSRRSSTDYSFSDGGSLSTPPTPHSEFGSSSKYFIENGQLSQNNKVPPPPFFPVPPTMTAAKMDSTYHSLDGSTASPRHSQSSGHTRKSSLDMLRPRTSSTSSRRHFQQSPLDTILASPKYSASSPSACSSPSPQSPMDRPYVTFKLLHPEANLVLRAPRVGLSLASLRTQVRDKFAASNCQVQLETEEAHWGLVWTAPVSEGSATRLLITEEDFLDVLERTASLEKVSLRVTT